MLYIRTLMSVLGMYVLSSPLFLGAWCSNVEQWNGEWEFFLFENWRSCGVVWSVGKCNL